MGDFFNTLLSPLTIGVAWVMLGWHKLWTTIGIGGGWAWALSIVGLTIVVRIVLIPLFVKQIHASRRMQLIQPEMQKIQAKYKGKTDPESRQAMTQETMDLYKKTGTNPFSSCLPILLQSPFFFALFTVLNHLKAIAEGTWGAIGPIDASVAQQIEKSDIFGAPFSSTFMGSTDLPTKIVTVVLIVLMSVSTFTTQRQLMRKNLPDSALDNPYMKQQTVILYLMPIFFALSGINFPIGVLLYWLTTNVWSMGQQFYVIRRMPAPGSAAERALHERQARKGKTVTPFSVKGLERDASGGTDGGGAGTDAAEAQPPVSRQRQQPKSAKRAKRTGGTGAAGGGAGGAGPASGGGSQAKPDAGTPQDQ
ncbi:MAG: membrane protein insertase YidC [Actinomycetales bacterium]|nr:membrane protein insertase YidC [Actinomycetales bacterium]